MEAGRGGAAWAPRHPTRWEAGDEDPRATRRRTDNAEGESERVRAGGDGGGESAADASDGEGVGAERAVAARGAAPSDDARRKRPLSQTVASLHQNEGGDPRGGRIEVDLTGGTEDSRRSRVAGKQPVQYDETKRRAKRRGGAAAGEPRGYMDRGNRAGVKRGHSGIVVGAAVMERTVRGRYEWRDAGLAATGRAGRQARTHG